MTRPARAKTRDPRPTDPSTGLEADTTLLAALRGWLRLRSTWVLLGAAALLRVLIGTDLWLHDPLTRHLLSDAAYYDRWAAALASGESFRAGLPYWLPPLYPAALGLLYRLTGGAVGATLVVQGLLGLAATVLLVAVAGRVVERRAALAAGWLWTFYAPVVFFENRLLAINVTLVPCLLALWYLLRAERRMASGRSAVRSAVAAGLCAGLAALARPNLILAVPAVLALWLARRELRPRAFAAGAALAASFVLVLTPAFVHNHAAAGAWLPVTANGGVNFWFGNNDEARGTFHAPGPEWGSIEAQRDVSVDIATRAMGRPPHAPLGDAEASAWWFARGRAWILEHPVRAASLWGKKLADTLSSTEFGIQYVLAASRRSARSLWLPCLPFGALLGLAALGWRGAAPGRTTLLAWLLAGLAASLLYFTYSRFRLPLLPALLPFAGRGAIALWDRRPPSALALALGALLLLQSLAPFEGDYPKKLVSNALVDTAAAAPEPVARQRLVEQALEAWPENPKALTDWGGRIQAQSEVAALALYERAVNSGFYYPEALRRMCQLLLTGSEPGVRDRARALELLRAWRASHVPGPHDFARLTALLAAGLLDADDARELDEAEALIRELGELNAADPALPALRAALAARRP